MRATIDDNLLDMLAEKKREDDKRKRAKRILFLVLILLVFLIGFALFSPETTKAIFRLLGF